jgi:hypothetical protein
MSRTVQQEIDIANVSCIYASNELQNGKPHGGLLDQRLPSLIHAYRQGLEWLYELDPTSDDLDTLGNYLISICKDAARSEAAIIGGGSVPGVLPNPGLPQPLDWIVSGSSSISAPLATGDLSVILDGTNNTVDFRGYNIEYARGGQPQYTTDPGDGSTYYSWDRNTGLFTISTAAGLGEPMRISPIS